MTKTMNDPLTDTARKLAIQGISTVPIGDCTSKRPSIPWKALQRRCPNQDEISNWHGDGLALVCGDVQCIDFDLPEDGNREHIEAFMDIARSVGLGDILDEMVHQRSPSGGLHLFFKCTVNPIANLKLASKVTGHKREVLIETRGAGGYVLIAPSPGYEIERGDLFAIPEITNAERELLLSCAQSLNQVPAEIIEDKPTVKDSLTVHYGERPGEAYDRDTETFFDLLESHGWRQLGNPHFWTRPDKTGGISATWDKVPGRFYVFSSNAYPLEPEKAYSPFAVYTILQHGGDFAAAARELGMKGYGDNLVRKASESFQKALEVKTSTLPPPQLYETFTDQDRAMPEVLIEGLLYRGGKMLIGAPSKARKTWLLGDLALSMATGGKWLGFQCQRQPVLFIDLELLRPDALKRLDTIAHARRIWDFSNLHVWTLRGYAITLDKIRQQLTEYCTEHGIGLIIIDPFYRISAGAVENAAEEISLFLANLEQVIRECNASVAMTHHFAKGNASGKDTIDRFSGSGVFARDPDALIVLTEADESTDAVPVFAAEMTVRSFTPPEARVISWQYPLWQIVRTGKAKLKKASGRPPQNTVDDLLRYVPENGIKSADLEAKLAEEEGISRPSYFRLKKEATERGLIWSVNGMVSKLSHNSNTL